MRTSINLTIEEFRQALLTLQSSREGRVTEAEGYQGHIHTDKGDAAYIFMPLPVSYDVGSLTIYDGTDEAVKYIVGLMGLEER